MAGSRRWGDVLQRVSCFNYTRWISFGDLYNSHLQLTTLYSTLKFFFERVDFVLCSY